jgi:hypothetical protein
MSSPPTIWPATCPATAGGPLRALAEFLGDLSARTGLNATEVKRGSGPC